ncbi:MAG: hypothetical protein ACYDH6_18625 [Acidimicrobiales bacterium]
MTGVARGSRAVLSAGVVVVAGFGFFAFVGPSAAAVGDACASFGAVAASLGARTAVDNTGELVNGVTADIPTAQAAADSQSVSSTYAAAPYPGSDVLSVFSLAGLPTSTYPPMAQTSYPTHPDASVTAPGVSLKGHSQETSSNASATSGAATGPGEGAGLMVATANAGCATHGTVKALAESDDQAVGFAGGLLRIGRVHSLAQVVVGANGVPRLDSKLEVAQMTVAGQTVELSPAGLSIGGSSTALPPSASLSQVLADAGVTVTYLAPTRDADGNGIVSAGVAITMARQAQATQPTTVSYVLGQSYARAQRGVSDTGLSPGTSHTAVLLTPPVGDSSASAAPPAAPTTETPAAARDLLAAPARPVSGPSVTPTGPAVPATLGLTAFSSVDIYLVIIVGAVMLLGSLLLVRILGVKTAWI